MTPQLDVGKLVGAASAPVALIIASCIFLGNLGGKYAMLMGIFRQLSGEYRDTKERDTIRCRSLEKQLTLHSSMLRSLMRATFWLTISVELFILTVVFTSIGVLFPNAHVFTWITGILSFAGLFVLAGAVGIEMVENYRAKQGLMLETAEFPGVLESVDQEADKRIFAAETRP